MNILFKACCIKVDVQLASYFYKWFKYVYCLYLGLMHGFVHISYTEATLVGNNRVGDLSYIFWNRWRTWRWGERSHFFYSCSLHPPPWLSPSTATSVSFFCNVTFIFLMSSVFFPATDILIPFRNHTLKVFIFIVFFIVLYSTLLHLPPLRFHCTDGCWGRTQDRCNWCIGSQTL